MCYMGLLFGICVVYESGVPLYVVWTSSKTLKLGSDPTISLSVDVRLEIRGEIFFFRNLEISTYTLY
jgi:hypothetical protein